MKRYGIRAVLVGVLAIAPTQGAAQAACSSMEECPAIVLTGVGFQQELATAGANALLGGVTSAMFRVVAGEPFMDAFWKGAVGGGLSYLGKRTAVGDFFGAGLLGREVSSIGGSVIRNASAGRDLLQELVLPVGPVRLYVSRDKGVVPRVDLSTLVVSAAFMATYEARLDPMESLSAGALVFRGESPMPGLTSAGAMVIWPDMPHLEGPRLMAHERVHVLQYDQMYLSWGETLERWLVSKVGSSGGLFDHVDLGLTALGLRTGLSMALDYHARPWESEAYLLAQREYPVITSPGSAP